MTDFEFRSAKSLDEALGAIRDAAGDYRVLAGGTNLIPDLRAGLAGPKLIVDLSRLDDLRYVREEAGRIEVGSLTTLADLINSLLVKDKVPVLWAAASQMAGPLVRNRATVGGNLVDASPAADTAVPLLALGAEVTLAGPDGSRRVALDRFFKAYRQVDLKPGEILAAVSFPTPPETARHGYHKLGRRNAMAISVASVAVMLDLNGDVCGRAGVALGAVAPTPIRSIPAEEVLAGQRVNADLAEAGAAAAARSASPISDIRATADYRKRMCAVLTKRVLASALGLEA